MAITAVIPTKGTRIEELGKIVARLIQVEEIDEIIIQRGDVGPFRRYEANTKNDIIYTQDDDCTTDVEKVISRYDKDFVVCGMTEERRPLYEKTREKLVGWGAVFHKNKLEVLKKYIDKYGKDDIYKRESDRIFTYLNQCRMERVVPIHFDSATSGNAMSLEPSHDNSRQEAVDRCKEID